MKRKHSFLTWLFPLAFALALAGCPLDFGNNEGDPLPKTEGSNEVKGKSWYTLDMKVEYAANGTYAVSWSLRYSDNYRTVETGSYSWNDMTKTITHKPEKTIYRQRGNLFQTLPPLSPLSSENGNITNDDFPPLNRSNYRQAIQEQIDGLTWFDGWIETQEFTKYEWINARLDADFALWAANYSLTGDGALLMQEKLPASVGEDELSGKRLNNAENTEVTYKFDEDAPVYFFEEKRGNDWHTTIFGDFAYYSSISWVFLRPISINGKMPLEYYDSVEISAVHKYPSGADYKAAATNDAFQMRRKIYTPYLVNL